MPTDFTWTSQPLVSDVEQAFKLFEAAQEADGGVEPVGEAVVRRLKRTPPGHVFLMAHDEEVPVLIAFADLTVDGDRATVEMVVHPDRRDEGLGRQVVEKLLLRWPGELWVWAHGDHPSAYDLAKRFRFTPARKLHQMRRDLTVALPQRPLPAGVTIRTFEPGRDEEAVVAVNNRAFSWHPEQAGLTVAELRSLEREYWFDPNGFFLAEDASGRLLGFHWTKIHTESPYSLDNDPWAMPVTPVGEVYVVATDPDAQGTGLGAALTMVGLEYLASRRLGEVMLYVESDNAAAVAMYEKLGFDHTRTDTAFRRG